jgi:hypothetical protein
MRGTVVLCMLLFFGFLAWRLTERLSPDALGLAIGVLLGILAGLPVALLLLAANRRRDPEEEDYGYADRRQRQLDMQPAQPPVIILGGYSHQGQATSHAGQYGAPRALPAPSEIVDARRFHVVGEEDEMVEEW